MSLCLGRARSGLIGHPRRAFRLIHHASTREEAPDDRSRLRHRHPRLRRLGEGSTSTTRRSASSRSTSTRPPTSRATSRAPSAGTGRASSPTASAATSPAARTSRSSSRSPASAPTPRSSCTATTTTGSPPGRTGSSSCSATTTSGSSTAGASTGSTTACRCRPTCPSHAATGYDLPEPDFSLRAFRDDILPRLGDTELVLVDVRSPAEFNGEIIAPPGMSETAQRPGHIPGAASIPWAQTVKEDGTFKDREDLANLYEAKGITPDKDVIAYCRIGERSIALLVRPARAARLQAGPQLRRQLDRVGQHGRRPDREADAVTAWYRLTRGPRSVSIPGLGRSAGPDRPGPAGSP